MGTQSLLDPKRYLYPSWAYDITSLFSHHSCFLAPLFHRVFLPSTTSIHSYVECPRNPVCVALSLLLLLEIEALRRVSLRIVPPEEWETILLVHHLLFVIVCRLLQSSWVPPYFWCILQGGWASSCSQREPAMGMVTVGTTEVWAGHRQHYLQFSSTFLLNLPLDSDLWERKLRVSGLPT